MTDKAMNTITAGLIKALEDLMSAVADYFGWEEGMEPSDGMEWFIGEYNRAKYEIEKAKGTNHGK